MMQCNWYDFIFNQNTLLMARELGCSLGLNAWYEYLDLYILTQRTPGHGSY